MSEQAYRETGSCGCVEHRSGERLREIIREKDQEIERLKKELEAARKEKA